MASIGSDANGYRRILFVAGDGSRKTVRLGKCSERDAEDVCRHIEDLVAANVNGQSLKLSTAAWLKDIGTTLHERLARTGLVDSRTAGKTPLATFMVDLFSTFAGKLKPNTLRNYEQARDCLLDYFAGRTIQSITAQEADEYAAWLRDGREKKLSAATAAKWIIVARQFFKRAVKWGLIPTNPFADVRGGSQANQGRQTLRHPRRCRKIAGSRPRRPMAGDDSLISVRWAALPQRGAGAAVERCGFRQSQTPRTIMQD